MLSFENVSEVKAFISDQEIEFVNFFLGDIDGRLRSVSIPADTFSEKTMERGIGFDASNFGFAEVDRSDKVLKPDLSYAFQDPVDEEHRILCFFCNMLEVDSSARFTQDLRHLVPKTLELLNS
ncbi:MAG: glutamine synthetase, partial [Gemmatimonadetes bacterium]|nr:glutamine synthetase [Gemmatimonadota bacterium]